MSIDVFNGRLMSGCRLFNVYFYAVCYKKTKIATEIVSLCDRKFTIHKIESIQLLVSSNSFHKVRQIQGTRSTNCSFLETILKKRRKKKRKCDQREPDEIDVVISLFVYGVRFSRNSQRDLISVLSWDEEKPFQSRGGIGSCSGVRRIERLQLCSCSSVTIIGVGTCIPIMLTRHLVYRRSPAYTRPTTFVISLYYDCSTISVRFPFYLFLVYSSLYYH